MGVLQVRIKGHDGKNAGIPVLYYGKERGNEVVDFVDGVGGTRVRGGSSLAVP